MIHTTRPSRRTGFTLIELLVAVSIIALLIAILLPALRNARDVARGAVCMSQLKQWGVAYMAYTVDFKQRLAPTRVNYPVSSKYNYATSLASYINPNFITIQGSGIASGLEWHKRTGVHRCPEKSGYSASGPGGAPGSFGNNTLYPDYLPNSPMTGNIYDAGGGVGAWGPVPYVGVPVTRLKKPSQDMLQVDGRGGTGHIDHMRKTDPADPWIIVDYRHADGCNILMVDGHVEHQRAPEPGSWLKIAYVPLGLTFE